MQIEGIDELGLAQEERHLLRVLLESEPRPVSARSLSLSLGVGVATVHEVLEPALVRLGLMTIGVGGRRLSDKGRRHLESVNVQEMA
jgi:Holliday junction resolvasome RuvABC ATP-dependent DNA helicase subunit